MTNSMLGIYGWASIALWALLSYMDQARYQGAEEADYTRLGLGSVGVLVGIVGTPMFIGGLVRFLASTRGSTAGPLEGTVAPEIRKLQDLRNEGALSEDEFTAAKARVLGRRDTGP